MRFITRAILLVFAVTDGTALPAGAQPPSAAPAQAVESLDAAQVSSRADGWLSAFEKTGDFSGVVVLAQGDKVLFEKAYGFADTQLRSPNRAETRFRVASLSKESGTRNPLRGDGYYSWDSGLDKSFALTERAKLQFRWEVFNVTNSVRFDPHSVSVNMDNEGSFGYAGSTLTDKRAMQVALRLQF